MHRVAVEGNFERELIVKVEVETNSGGYDEAGRFGIEDGGSGDLVAVTGISNLPRPNNRLAHGNKRPR